jgi:YD repeat-containing protein
MRVDRYAYDTAGRAISSSFGGGTKTETYSYDGFGNLKSRVASAAPVTLPPIDPGTNKIAGYPYDAAGNLTAFAGAEFDFDALNMMTKIRTQLGQVKRFIYTPDDERIGIQIQADGWSRWKVRDFENHVIREYEAGSGSTWLWAEDFIYAGGRLVAGEVVSCTTTSTTSARSA